MMSDPQSDVRKRLFWMCVFVVFLAQGALIGLGLTTSMFAPWELLPWAAYLGAASVVVILLTRTAGALRYVSVPQIWAACGLVAGAGVFSAYLCREIVASV